MLPHVSTEVGNGSSLTPAFATVGEPKDLASLFSKVVAARKTIATVAKDTTIRLKTGGSYTVVSSAAISTVAQDALDQAGLFFSMSVANRTAGNGYLVIDYQFTLGCPETGAMMIIPWVQEGKQTGDKDLAAIHTYAKKYFFIHQFVIPVSDDTSPDLENRDGDYGKPKKSKPSGPGKRKPKGKKPPPGNDPEKWPSPTLVKTLADDLRIYIGLPDYGAERIVALGGVDKENGWDQYADAGTAKKAIAAKIDAEWPNYAAFGLARVKINSILDNDVTLSLDEIAKLVGAENASDWKALSAILSKYETREKAQDAAILAFHKPPTPPEQPDDAGQHRTTPDDNNNAWAGFDEFAMNDEAVKYGFAPNSIADPEYAGRAALEELGKKSWLDFENRRAASVALRQHVIDAKKPLEFDGCVPQGNYNLLECNTESPSGGIVMKLWGRDQLRALDPDLKALIDDKDNPWVKGEPVLFSDPIRIVKWEAMKSGSFQVCKDEGSVALTDIPF